MNCGLREVIQQTDSIYIASSSVLAELLFFFWSLLKNSAQIDRLSLVTLMKMGTKGETKKIFQQ